MTRTKNKANLGHLQEDQPMLGAGRKAAPLCPAYGKTRSLLCLTTKHKDKCDPAGRPMYPGKGATAAHLPPVRRFSHSGIRCQGLHPASGSADGSLPPPRLSQDPSLPGELPLPLHPALEARTSPQAQMRSQPKRNRHRSLLSKPCRAKERPLLRRQLPKHSQLQKPRSPRARLRPRKSPVLVPTLRIAQVTRRRPPRSQPRRRQQALPLPAALPRQALPVRCQMTRQPRAAVALRPSPRPRPRPKTRH